MTFIKEAEIFIGEAEFFLGSVVGSELDFSVKEGKYVLVLSTTVASIAIYLLTMAISYFSKTFHRLSKREKVFWCLSVVRGFFGVLSAGLGWLCWFDDKLHKHAVYGSTPISDFSVSIALGFFFFEVSMLLGSNVVFRFFDPVLACHHVLALYMFWTTAHLDLFASLLTQALILEMTTPFSCICWVLLKMKRGHTAVWKINQMILIHLFHCRSIIEFCVLYQIVVNRWEIWATWSDWTHLLVSICHIGAAVLCALWMTPFWLYKKTWQLFNPVDWNHASSASARQAALVNGEVRTSESVEHTLNKREKMD